MRDGECESGNGGFGLWCWESGRCEKEMLPIVWRFGLVVFIVTLFPCTWVSSKRNRHFSKMGSECVNDTKCYGVRNDIHCQAHTATCTHSTTTIHRYSPWQRVYLVTKLKSNPGSNNRSTLPSARAANSTPILNDY